MQSPIRISSCLTSQGAGYDENGKLPALGNPTEKIHSSASLFNPFTHPHPHVPLPRAHLDILSRSLVQFWHRMVII